MHQVKMCAVSLKRKANLVSDIPARTDKIATQDMYMFVHLFRFDSKCNVTH